MDRIRETTVSVFSSVTPSTGTKDARSILYPHPQTSPLRRSDEDSSDSKDEGSSGILHLRPQMSCQWHSQMKLRPIPRTKTYPASQNQLPGPPWSPPVSGESKQQLWSDSKIEGSSGILHRRPQTSPQWHIRWGSIRFQGQRPLQHPRTSFQCYLGVDLYLLKWNRRCSWWLLLVRLRSSECKHSSSHRCLKPYHHIKAASMIGRTGTPFGCSKNRGVVY